MKPYAFRGDGTDATGCCPNHDWPPTKRWGGMYHSAHSRKGHRESNRIAKRERRRIDKQKLKKEDIDEI